MSAKRFWNQPKHVQDWLIKNAYMKRCKGFRNLDDAKKYVYQALKDDGHFALVDGEEYGKRYRKMPCDSAKSFWASDDEDIKRRIGRWELILQAAINYEERRGGEIHPDAEILAETERKSEQGSQKVWCLLAVAVLVFLLVSEK